MRLNDWLKRNAIRRTKFAHRIGVSPATVTALCNSATPWMSRATAEAIVRETGGEVGPGDFLIAPAAVPSEQTGAAA